MSGHSESCGGSRDLCDQLFTAVKQLIPALKCGPTRRWCGYYAPGRKRFAYVSHFKMSDRVEVWCLGPLKDLQRASPPLVRARTQTAAGGWEDGFPGRFEITDPSQIPSAALLLRQVSYAHS
jgi:hypothetical protein